MMVKVQTEKGWMIFDNIDNVSYSSCGDDINDYLVTLQTNDFNLLNSGDQNHCSKVALILTKGSECFMVLAYCPVFLLNNDGKTVDRI